jgi:hypothetical protein
MSVKKDLIFILTDLQKLYDDEMNNNPSSNRPIYYSKLALLELSGWIEKCWDELLLNFMKNRLTEQGQIKEKVNLLNGIHGYNYDKYRNFIITLIGLIRYNDLKLKLENKNILPNLTSKMYKLNQDRGEMAHTAIAIPGKVFNYSAPSTFIRDLNDLEYLLHNYEIELNKF